MYPNDNHLQTPDNHSNGESDRKTSRKRRLAEISNITEDEPSNSDSSTQNRIASFHETGSSILVQRESCDGEDTILPSFKPNDRVYAGETGDIYLATITLLAYHNSTNQTSKSGHWKYLVHFNGWNSRHDKWLSEEHIYPDNEASQNMAEQSKLKARDIEKKRKEKKTLAEKEKKRKHERRQSSDAAIKGRTAKGTQRRHSQKSLTMQECCALPISLQIIIVDEQSEVTRLGKLTVTGYDAMSSDTAPARKVHDLPASITVKLILKEFAKSSIKSKQAESKGIDSTSTHGKSSKLELRYKSFASDTIRLFDAMLPKCLLYSYEQGQYSKLCEKKEAKGASDSELSMSEVYSGEFLLRMLARLPYILSAIDTTSECQGDDNRGVFARWRAAYENEGESSAELMAELVVFLQQNRDKIFKGKYRESTPDEYTSSERRFADKHGAK